MSISGKNIIRLSENPELQAEAAKWFSGIWRYPQRLYLESMKSSVSAARGVPEWYVAEGPGRKIIAGLGVIENDFHKRKDLTPNVAALFVEEEQRGQGLARELLETACEDLKSRGFKAVYLLTDNKDFYEHCGWQFFGMVEENEGDLCRCYVRKL